MELLRETRFINHTTVTKKASVHLEKKITLPKDLWLIKTLTTIVAYCIILFDFYKCRPIHLENVFRLVPSA